MGEGKPGVKVRGLRVEEIVERLAEKLMPLLDRSNRMMLRNLKALREHRRPPTPSVSIGQAGQVNVGAQQVNATGDHGKTREPACTAATCPNESQGQTT